MRVSPGHGCMGAWTRGGVEAAKRLATETEAVWATAVCFLLGVGGGVLLLGADARPLIDEGALAMPGALIAGAIAAAAFVVSTLRHRRGETAPMPRWQAVVSDLSSGALTVAFAGVTAMGVLLAAQIFAIGLEGLQLGPLGGGLLAGVVAATGGRFAFGAGVGLRTVDLAGLLFGYLVIGTLFAMLTAADPRWWELNFSQLGSGAGSWAFNGTLLVAGLLIATVGSYIGRDLHRMLGDGALMRIAWTVALWALAGVALAAVGLLPLDRVPLPHNIVASAALVLFMVAAVRTAGVVPGPPRALVITTAGVTGLLVIAVLLWRPFGFYPLTALEAVAVGLGLLWMMTLVRVLAVLAPPRSRPSARAMLTG